MPNVEFCDALLQFKNADKYEYLRENCMYASEEIACTRENRTQKGMRYILGNILAKSVHLGDVHIKMCAT